MPNILYAKMQATGNSFLVVEGEHASILERGADWVQGACSVGFGLGTNGLVALRKEASGSFHMSMYNANGTKAEMCGNALLCVGKVLADKGLVKDNAFEVATDSGSRTIRILSNKTLEAEVEADMGTPSFAGKSFHGKALQPVRLGGKEYTYASMGNPHAVAFVSDFGFDVEAEGRKVENALHVFPNKTNVEYVVPSKDGRNINLRVWERGCGETLGCGTGACAAVVVATEKGLLKRGKQTAVQLRGGELFVGWKPNNHVWMQGKAQSITKGMLHLKDPKEDKNNGFDQAQA